MCSQIQHAMILVTCVCIYYKIRNCLYNSERISNFDVSFKKNVVALSKSIAGF